MFSTDLLLNSYAGSKMINSATATALLMNINLVELTLPQKGLSDTKPTVGQ